MKKDKNKWNLRYKKHTGNFGPSTSIEKNCHFVPTGNALDIACGNGRNSFYLAQKGFMVDAVDISDVAIERLTDQHPNIIPMCKDINTWKIKENHYHLIVNIRFLEKQLFPGIAKGLVSGGLLIFETFIGKKNGIGKKNESYCLMENELLFAFPDFRVIFYEEKKTDAASRFDQTVTMVAIKK